MFKLIPLFVEIAVFINSLPHSILILVELPFFKGALGNPYYLIIRQGPGLISVGLSRVDFNAIGRKIQHALFVKTFQYISGIK